MQAHITKAKTFLSEGSKGQLQAGLTGTAAMLVLLVFRIVYTGELKYMYLIWNVVLVWVAWLLGVWFLYSVKNAWQKWQKITLFIAWLGFLPNTFYMLTDMVHPVLNYDRIPGFHGSNFGSVPNGTMILFDIGLVGLGVWVGWYLGVVSLSDAHQFFEKRFGRFRAVLYTQIIIAASSFAIYLGRTPRLNTWDLLVRPWVVVQTVVEPLLHPIEQADAYGMTALFIVLISVIFWSVHVIKTGEV